jgi:NAD(P)-dependent dehydrogenase (short-subunit alcohol dehydrogenase family)
VNVQLSSSKNLLIIGATSSIAPALVSLAQNREYQVTGTYRNSQKMYGEITEWLKLDLSSQSSVQEFIQDLGGRSFDLVIYLAGATRGKIDPQEYIESNLLNPLILFEMLTVKLAQETPSCFIFISSRAAKHPSFDVYYSAVKSGLSAALRSLSATAHPDSKFLSLLPGLIVGSNMYEEMDSKVRESHKTRSCNKLLDIKEAASEIFNVVDNKESFVNGEMIEVGPIY